MNDTLAETSDEMLMARYRRGDRAAFGELASRYQNSLFHFISRYIGNRARAKELTQDTFLRVVRSSATFRHESRFSTWIFTIARNLCFDELRRTRHHHHESLDELDESGRNSTLNRKSLAWEDPGFEGGPLRHHLLAAIEKLPDEQREVFLLRHIGDVPFDEIAKITGSQLGTVKSRMRYALDRLRKELKDFEEEGRSSS